MLAGQIVMGMQFAVMGAVGMEYQGLPPGMRENKMASCMGLFFVGNMISGGFTKTNAFEIYFNEKLLWSTLKTQRKPNMQDIVKSFKKAGIRIQS